MLKYRRALAAAGLLLFATAMPAAAQSLKDQLVGTWNLISNTEEYTDGKKVAWGPDPKGIVMFDAANRFSLQIIVGGRAKASGNPAENPVGKVIAYFGTYTTNDAGKELVFQITGASFPNWDGTEQKRVVTGISGSELTYKAIAPIPSGAGPFVPVLVWSRAK